MLHVDLEESTRQYLNARGFYDLKSLNFGRVKLNVRDMVWERKQVNPAETGSVRVVELANQSSEEGRGCLNITKQGKPVFKFTLQTGLIKGLSNRVKFPGPSGVFNEFFAPVNKKETLIQDHTAIQMETCVPLGRRTTAHADVSNTSKIYRGEFTCNGTLDGKVFVERENNSVLEVPLSDMVYEGYVTLPVQLKGNIDVNFQNNHAISVTR